MSVLQIFLFGTVRIARDGQLSEVKVTRCVQGLLAYLLLQRHRRHHREVLAGLFWGDHREHRARSCLNTALWRLRCVLEPEGIPRGTYLATTPTGEIGFNRNSDYWLDVEVFEEQVGRALTQPIQAMEAADVRELENILQLYNGELLEGFYDDWVLRERERLSCLYLESLMHLMRYYRHHGDYERSLACGQQILYHDSLREEIHREMMRLYLESGQRALAVRQYEICCKILDAELDIPPMEETQALYVQIVGGPGHRQSQSTMLEEPQNLHQALHQIHLAMQNFDEARKHLHRSIRFIRRFAQWRDKE